MNFLNFLTSKSSLLNFNLLSQSPAFQRENTILVEPLPPKLISEDSGKQLLPAQLALPGGEGEQKQKLAAAGEISQLLSQEQMLINQYMELKLKYLANCLSISQSQPEEPKPSTVSQEQVTLNPGDSSGDHNVALRKKIKKRNKCGHEEKSHYAKGMCNNCYHKYGRTKKPWNCSHDKLYAAGMCQNCYINNYNRRKREEKEDKEDRGDRDGEKIEHDSVDLHSSHE